MTDNDLAYAIETAIDDIGIRLGPNIRPAFVARTIELLVDVAGVTVSHPPDTTVGQSAMPPTADRQLPDWPQPLSPQSHLLEAKRYAASGAPAEIRQIWDEVGQRYVPPPPQRKQTS